MAQAKNNMGAAEKILAIIKQEKECSRWQRLHYTMSKKEGRSVFVVQRELEGGAIEEFSTQSSVERTIWEDIHSKQFYLAEQAPICQG